MNTYGINLATRRIMENIAMGNYPRAHEIIRDLGWKIGESECSIEFHAIGDDVVCVRSHTQIDFSGKLSSNPFFKPPAHMTPTESWVKYNEK